jgi:hypothetical protein
VAFTNALKEFSGQEYGLSVAPGAEAEGLLCLNRHTSPSRQLD